MELFKPSKKVLEMVCSDNKEVLSLYNVYPFETYDEMMNLCVLHFVGIHERIGQFYRHEIKGDKLRLNTQSISDVVTELFYNWATHSSEGTDFLSGLFLGDLGICHGLKDEDFFKRSEIKNQLENKIRFEEFDKKPRDESTSCHWGYNDHIFPNSDFIEVDVEKGILYCVQLKKNIIAPEGEHGSQYFYNLKEKKKQT